MYLTDGAINAQLRAMASLVSGMSIQARLFAATLVTIVVFLPSPTPNREPGRNIHELN